LYQRNLHSDRATATAAYKKQTTTKQKITKQKTKTKTT
jgi:hypothetical protein